MKILVTGGAGFIGYHLCLALLREGHVVICLDNINDYYSVDLKYARLKELGICREKSSIFFEKVYSEIYGNNLCFIRMNLEDRNELPKLFKAESFDVVCNMAAQAGVRYSIENPETYIDSNIVGFLNLLECSRHNKIKHLLYASSSSVYGQNSQIPFSEDDRVDEPISLYAATKKSNELMAYTYSHLFNLPTSGLRFFTVYGPWGRPDMAIYLFTDAISKGRPINVFNHGNMERDFTFIEDIVQGILLTLHNIPEPHSNTVPSQLFNIGNNKPEALGDFISAIEKALNIKAIKNFLPMQPGDVPRTWADVRALETIGYSSKTSMNDGIEKFVSWYQNYNA